MDVLYGRALDSIRHLMALDATFADKESFEENDKRECELYQAERKSLIECVNSLQIDKLLYAERGRQMILADIIEYMFLGRGYLSERSDRSKYLAALLHFVNLLMTYEAMTVSAKLRKRFLANLEHMIPAVAYEANFNALASITGSVGLPLDSNSELEHRKLNKYFDTLLPKTAGGLWHELLVYAFLLRGKFGYVVPLLLHQRLLGPEKSLVPPDFLIISHDKRIYGVEVGLKKETQSGEFALRTAIPTATVDTANARTSDRCPICNKWIHLCPFVIEKFVSTEEAITKPRVRCFTDCNLFSRKDIAEAKCPYSKYSRSRAKSKKYTQHEFANGKHYHYSCVLNKLTDEMRDALITGQDETAVITHFPYYSGLEALMPRVSSQGTTSMANNSSER